MADESRVAQPPTEQLISEAVLSNYFENLSDLLIEMSDKDFDLNDRFIVEPKEVWIPAKHDYFLIQNEITSLNSDKTVSINTIMKRSKLSQVTAEDLGSYHEVELEVKKEIKELLFKENFQQVRFGDFYFISPLVPSLKEITVKRMKFKDTVKQMLETRLLPKIANEYFGEHDLNAVYSVKLSDPEFSIAKDPSNPVSFLSLIVELLDRNQESIGEFNVTLDFKYLDYEAFNWIYENIGEVDTTHLTYQEEVNQAIEELVDKKQALTYDGVSFMLLDYNGLSARDKEIALPTEEGQMAIQAFADIFQQGGFSDFLVSAEPLTTNQNIIKAITTNGFVLFIGPNGISSSRGIIYSPNDKEHHNLRSAAQLISRYSGIQSDDIPTLVALYDGRRIKKIMQQKALEQGGQ